MNKKILVFIIGAAGLYLLSTGVSYAAFSFIKPAAKKIAYKPPTPVATKAGTAKFDPTLPKTESCPLTGQLFSKQQREWWEKHRPLGVMIENHQEARPQSGLSNADIIYEAVAEGGITRFLAIFYCQDTDTVGPVRSARTYFLDFISEYGSFPLYAHVGGANTPGPANALGQIEDYGWGTYNDLNQFSIGFPTFWRDYERLGHPVATEHTMYATTQKLWDFAASKRELTNIDKKGVRWEEDFKPWKFKDDAPASERGIVQSVNFSFWEGYGQYEVKWVYDAQNNLYKRENGGQPHKDKNNDKQLEAKNVVVLLMAERNANDGYDNNLHLLYGTKGTGKALIFQDGKKIEASWQKKNRESRMLLTDSKGNEVKFNRGKIWLEILPTGNTVTAQ